MSWEADYEEEGTNEIETHFTNALDFFENYLRHLYARQLSRAKEQRWSDTWWDNPEARIRITALWRSWEYMRLDPNTGISSWLRDHADYHMRVLFSIDGPFTKARTENPEPGPLPHTPPPPDVAESFN